MAKKDERLFNPQKVQRKGRWKGIVLGFVVFAVVFGGAAVGYLYSKLDDSNTDKIMDLFEKKPEIQVQGSTGGLTNILLSCVSTKETVETGKKEMYFLVLARADATNGVVSFCPLPVKDSYIQSYENGGASEVANVIAQEYAINVNRYIFSNENTFALAINYMDGLEYTVDKRIEYRTKDLTLILTPGQQTIKGESLLKYLKYCKETDPSRQGSIFCAMVKNYFNYKNYEKAMTVYKGVLECLSTNSDITYVDAADNLKNIEVIIKNSGNNAVTVSSVEELK